MALVQRGSRYYAVIYIGADKPRRSIPLGANRAIAKRQHAEIMLAQQKHLPLPTLCKTPFSAQVEQFLKDGTASLAPATKAAYESRLQHHFVSDPLFGDRPLHRVMTTANISRWQATALENGVSDTLVLSCLTALGSMASWCVDTGVLVENCVRRVRKPRTPKPQSRSVLAPEQVGALIRATPREHRPLMTFLALTGCRPSEAAALDFASVGFATNEIVIRRGISRGVIGDTKNHRERTFPLPPALRASLEEQKRKTPNTLNLVFPAEGGGIMNMSWFTRAVFIPSLRRAGLIIPDGSRSLYLLRRSCATNLMASGTASVRVIADLLGHDPNLLVSTYLQARQGEAEGAVASLELGVFGESDQLHREAV